MRLSIVTITYNNPEELKETISSIPDKEFLEAIIINGGNLKVEEKFLGNIKTVILNEKDEGIADAFNKGLKLSSGDAVMFLNSGDILTDRNYPEKALKILKENHEYSFVHSNILYSDRIGGDLIVKPSAKSLGRGMKYLHPTMVIRKKLFEKTGVFNTHFKIAMDFDLIVRIEKEGFKGFYVDESPVVKMSGSGKSHIDEFKGLIECAKSLKKNDYLTIANLYGLIIRFYLFFLRKFLIAIGAEKVLRYLKRKKYKHATY